MKRRRYAVGLEVFRPESDAEVDRCVTEEVGNGEVDGIVAAAEFDLQGGQLGVADFEVLGTAAGGVARGLADRDVGVEDLDGARREGVAADVVPAARRDLE